MNYRPISAVRVCCVSGLWLLLLAVHSPTCALADHEITVVESQTDITVRDGGQIVVTYNKTSPAAPPGIDPVFERSGCLHPVRSPQGRTVTEMFPVDHPHQHGVFSAWVKTTYDGQPVDFWNLAGGTGRVLHERVIRTFREADGVGFEVDLIHRMEAKPPVDVLRERWKVTVRPTGGKWHCFDLESEQIGITDKPLVVNQYHYGGIALRGPARWVSGRDADKKANVDREPSAFLNDLRSDRIKGNHEHAKWVALTGTQDGNPVTVAVLSHSGNPRAPQAARLHPTKPYFCFAPCVDGEFTIDREHRYRVTYRYLITDEKPDPDWIDEQWTSWHGK